MTKTAALRVLLAVLALSSLFAACSGAAAPPASGTPTPPSASPGDPGNGVVDPGQPQFVVPKPGQQNVHPVSVVEMDARVEGRHAVLNARWWSGVEPCSVLDSVAWKRDGTTITISVREGSGGGDVICIDIAVYKATIIDLGELDPGEYTVLAGEGTAPPITFKIV